MATVGQKYQTAKDVYGLSDEQFGQLFEQNTGRKFTLAPDLLNQNYGDLLQQRKAPPPQPQAQAEEPGFIDSAVDIATTVGKGATRGVAETLSGVAGGVEQILQRGGRAAAEVPYSLADMSKLNEEFKAIQQDEEEWKVRGEQALATGDNAIIERYTSEHKQALKAREARLAQTVKGVERTQQGLQLDDERKRIRDKLVNEIPDRMKNDFLDNARNDLLEMIEAFPILFTQLVSDGAEDATGFINSSVDAGQEGRELGQQLVDGALGTTGLVVSRLAGSVYNTVKEGDSKEMDPFWELLYSRPVTVLTTLLPFFKPFAKGLRTAGAKVDPTSLARKKKLVKAAEAGDKNAAALLEVMQDSRMIRFLENGNKAIQYLDELPGRALKLKKERPVASGRTYRDIKEGADLFTEDLSTTPMRMSDIAGSAARGAGLGLLAGDPALGAAITTFLTTTMGLAKNSSRFNAAIETVAQYLSRINAGKSISVEIAKRQLANDAPQIRDFLRQSGLQLKSLSERGKLFEDAPSGPASRRAVKPEFDVSEAGIITPRRTRNAEAVQQTQQFMDNELAGLAERKLETFGKRRPKETQAQYQRRMRKLKNEAEVELKTRRNSITEALRAADEVEVLKKSGLVENTRRYTPEAQKIIDSVASALDRVGVKKNDQLKYSNYLDDVREGGMSLLRSETMVAEVLNRIVKGMSYADKVLYKDSLARQLRDIAALPRVGKGGEVAVLPKLNLTIKGQKVSIDIQGNIDDALKALSKKKQDRVTGEVMGSFVHEQSIKAAGRARNMAMDAEAARPLIAAGVNALKARQMVQNGKVTPMQYADAILRKALTEGAAIPQVLPRNIGLSQLQNGLMALAKDPSFIRSLGAKAKAKVVEKRARKIVEELKAFKEEGFRITKPGEAAWGLQGQMGFRASERHSINDVIKMLDDEQAITNPDLKRQLNALVEAADEGNILRQGAEGPISGRFISKSLDKTFSHLDDLRIGSTTLDKALYYLKYNLTIGRLATTLNNFTSNIWYQGIRRGDPLAPLTVGVSRLAEFNKFIKTGEVKGNLSPGYVSGSMKNPKLKENIFQQIKEGGITRSNIIDAELAVMEQALKAPPVTGLGKGLSLAAKPLAVPFKVLRQAEEAAYRVGDELFKVDEMYQVMSTLYDRLGGLKKGQFVEIKTGPNSLAQIRKGADGNFYQGTRKLGRLEDKKLAKILGAAGRRSAVDLFVDYASKPGAVMALQSMGPLALVSPFLTWHFKAMGLGERGFLQRALNPDDVIVRTDNLGISAKQAVAQIKAGMVRQAIVAETRREMTEDRDYFRKIMSYVPGNLRAALFADIADPRFVRVASVGGQDFTSSEAGKLALYSEAIRRIGTVFGREPVTPAQKKAALRAAEGQRPGMELALRSLGMSEQPLTDLIQLGLAGGKTSAGRPDRRGKVIETDEFFRKYVFPFALGGTKQSAFEILGRETGVLDDHSRLSNRFKTFDPEDPAAHERLMDYYIRSLIGVGFKPVAIIGKRGAIERYLKHAKRTVNSAFNEAEKRYVDKASKDPNNPDLAIEGERLGQLAESAAMIMAEIEAEIWEDYSTIMEGREKRAKPSN